MITVARNHSPGPTERFDRQLEHKRLLVVDDHAAVRAGLRELLDDETDFEVVAAVADAESALSVAEQEPVDVAVVDYQLPGRNGLWVSRKLKRLPEPPAVVVYSAYADDVLAAAAVVAQANAIVNKGGLGSELCEAIRRVSGNRNLLPPMPSWLGEALRRRLGPEEQTTFGMLLAGIELGEIAETLGLSEAGLESQLCGMLRRLEAPPARPRDRLGGRRGA